TSTYMINGRWSLKGLSRTAPVNIWAPPTRASLPTGACWCEPSKIPCLGKVHRCLLALSKRRTLPDPLQSMESTEAGSRTRLIGDGLIASVVNVHRGLASVLHENNPSASRHEQLC